MWNSGMFQMLMSLSFFVNFFAMDVDFVLWGIHNCANATFLFSIWTTQVLLHILEHCTDNNSSIVIISRFNILWGHIYIWTSFKVNVLWFFKYIFLSSLIIFECNPRQGDLTYKSNWIFKIIFWKSCAYSRWNKTDIYKV